LGTGIPEIKMNSLDVLLEDRGNLIVHPSYLAARMDLVTGATGIVGAHVVCELLQEGRSVRAIARGHKKTEHLHQVLSHYGLAREQYADRLELIDADILNVSDVSSMVQGIEYLYHAAAMVSFAPHEKELMWKVNVEGTANLVNAASQHGVKRFCHVSSVASIGRHPGGELSNESTLFEEAAHVSPYSYTKYYAELEIHRGIAEGLDAFMVNPSVIIGPGLKDQSSMALVDKVSRGTGFYPIGGAAIVDARDVAHTLIVGSTQAEQGERYLLVGEHTPYKDLFARIAKAAGIKAPTRKISPMILRLAARVESVRNFFFKSTPLVTKYTAHSASSHYRYDNSKAQHELGITFIGIDEALRNALAFRNR